MTYKIVQNLKTKLYSIQSKSIFGVIDTLKDSKNWTVFFESPKLAEQFISEIKPVKKHRSVKKT